MRHSGAVAEWLGRGLQSAVTRSNLVYEALQASA